MGDLDDDSVVHLDHERTSSARKAWSTVIAGRRVADLKPTRNEKIVLSTQRASVDQSESSWLDQTTERLHDLLQPICQWKLNTNITFIGNNKLKIFKALMNQNFKIKERPNGNFAHYSLINLTYTEYKVTLFYQVFLNFANSL